MKKKLFIFGFGYVAKHLSQILANEYNIIGTSRTSTCDTIIAWNGTDYDEEIVNILLNADAILCAIPPNETGDLPVQIFADSIKQSNASWLGYLSTTGVYGDHQGSNVNELTPLKPTNNRAKRRVIAEQQWQTLGTDKKSVQIFRLPGIYGLGRSAFDALDEGRAKRIDMRLKNGDKHFFCRAHVEDIAGTIKAAMLNHIIHHEIFNIVDDLPAPNADIIKYAAQKMGADVPELLSFEQANMSDMAKSFYDECKFMKNDRLKQLLGYNLKYPSYTHGLDAIWAKMSDQDGR